MKWFNWFMAFLLTMCGSQITHACAQVPAPRAPVVQVADVPVFDCTRQDSPYVNWRMEMGNSAGPIALSGSLIFVGTNNSPQSLVEKNPDLAVLMCIDRESGKILWQVRHARLPDRGNDIPGTAIQSRPTIDEERLYYVSNRGELVCLTMNSIEVGSCLGQQVNGITIDGTGIAILWRLDMREKLGIVKRDALGGENPLPSPVVSGDLVITATSHGRSTWKEKLHATAPSLVAANKRTGEIVWTSDLPGEGIVFSQWSSPVITQLDGRTQLIFPAGDGCLYGLDPTNGQLLWRHDATNPRDHAIDQGLPGTGFYFPPLIVQGDRVYFSIRGSSLFTVRAVEIRSEGGQWTSESKWSFDDPGIPNRGGSPVFHMGRIFVAKESGHFIALQAETGQPIWKVDLLSPPSDFGTPVVAGSHALVPTEDGLFDLSAGEIGQCFGRFKLGGPVRGTPVVDGNQCYVTTDGFLWCLRLPEMHIK